MIIEMSRLYITESGNLCILTWVADKAVSFRVIGVGETHFIYYLLPQ